MLLIRRQLIKIILLVGVVVLLGLVMLYGRPVASTFANGSGLQLTIGSYAVYNGDFQGDQSWALKDLLPGVDKFFNLNNILPGDRGMSLMSAQVDGTDAYICLDFLETADQENGGNEPESHEDTTPEGELSEVVELFGWRDDGDGEFEVGETPLFGTTTETAVEVLSDNTFPLADASNEEIFFEGVTYYVGIEWCFGDLVVDLGTADVSCDGQPVGNEYQTDSFSFDASLRAVEATYYTDYTCDPTVDLYLNKQISGADQGFSLDQFSYHVTGSSTFGFEYIDEIVPHDSTVELPVGVYTIEELVPEGFVKEDWRIGWYGQCESGSAFTTTIEIEPRDTRIDTLYCEADNQYRPGDDNGPGEASGNSVAEDDDNTVVTSVDNPDDSRWSEVERSGWSTLIDRATRSSR